MTDTADAERLREAVEGVLDVPLHRALALELVAVEPGRAQVRLPIGETARNNVGVLHGGVLYLVLDVAAYLATLPLLEPGENAVTHDLSVSVLRPASAGEVLDVEAQVLRRGRRLVFVDSEARVGDRVVGVGRVTKSVVGGPAG